MGHADRKETVMTCRVASCPGVYEARDVVHTVRHGERLLVIDHVPAEVCTVCGDVLFSPETVRRLEALRRTTAAPTATVPLYDFAASLSA